MDEQQTFDADHLVSITALDDHTRKLFAQGRYPEAEIQARKAVVRYEKVLGPTHETYMWALYRLALTLEYLYKFDEAEHLCRLALSVAHKALRKDDDSYLEIVNTLGTMLSSQGRNREAKEQYDRVLACYKKSVGLDDPKGLSIRNNVALLLMKRQQYETAELDLRKAPASN